MREDKIKEMIKEVLAEHLQNNKTNNLWSKVNKNESDIKEMKKATIDVLPTLLAIWDNPIFNGYRTKNRGI